MRSVCTLGGLLMVWAAACVTGRTLTGAKKGSSEYNVDIRMPGVLPTKDDMYVCTAMSIPQATQYIVQYEALAKGSTAHHMILFGCEVPAGEVNHWWECGAICQGSEPTIMFAWAKNAPPTKLPKDVGFHIGQGSKVRTLVLQIHYLNAFPAYAEPDRSGLRMTMTQQRQKYLAGIYILMSYWLTIPPHKPKVHSDVACQYKGKNKLYPFAYRVHAHTLGRVVTGYQYNTSWTLLGKGNPQWPQAFYPMSKKYEIKPDDYVAARCTYNSTLRDRTTNIGATHNDEMCNFYIMYYTEDNSNAKSFFECGGNNVNWLTKKLPADSDVQLPPNPALEMVANGVAKSNHEVSPVSQNLGIKVVPNWPKIQDSDHLQLGQIGGVAVDSKGNIHVFHRGSRKWDATSFDVHEVFNQKDQPIKENTFVVFDPSGKVIKQWGSNMFFMPHGLYIDGEDSLWVTDVALHQVMRFKVGEDKPSLILGTKFAPGKDNLHFCKPTDVAVLSTGEFFVSDGYCNSRIMKFSKEGKLIKQWGNSLKSSEDDGYPPKGSFDLPHSLALAETENKLCVADRENGRIQCFDFEGKFLQQFHPKEFGSRVFAISHCKLHSKHLFAVNGEDFSDKKITVQGFTIDLDTGELVRVWKPSPNKGFDSPHDLTMSPDGTSLYVGEIGPNVLWKFSVAPGASNPKNNPPSVVQQGSGADKKSGKPQTVDQAQAHKKEGQVTDDFGPSLIIGGLLVIPILIIVLAVIFVRLRNSGKLVWTTDYRSRNKKGRFNIGNFFNRHKGFDRLPNEESDHELDHLTDSDVEEYSATTQKA